MSETSTVVGVFTDDIYANLAADELRRVGFSDDEISVIKKRPGSGGLVGNLKSLLKGQEAGHEATADDFMRMGVPEQAAGYCQSELEAGRTIEVVRVAGQQKEVVEILRHFGAAIPERTGLGDHAETNPPPVAPDMYDPITNRDADDSIMTPEDPR